MSERIPVNVTVYDGLPKEVVEAVGTIVVSVELVRQWGQRVEPPAHTPIYQNTSEDDNPPPEAGIFLDHGWREFPVSNGDRVGIYLGHSLVAVVKTVGGC